MTIQPGDSTSLTFPSTSRVVVQDYLVFVSDGKVIGRLNAEFDFSSLPLHLHHFAVHHLMMRRSNFDMPLAPAHIPTPPSTSAAPSATTYGSKGIIEKLRSYFRKK